MNTLIINTYAGSLLLGADRVPNSRIIGSFEDSGFGAEITRANHERFRELDPSFRFIDQIAQWPQDLDLTNVAVLAHPPCAAFSNQNTSSAKRGINTDAFDCTRKVLTYAMGGNAAAIAVESVPGALMGAWDVHDAFGQRYGYHVYRILKNSICFGVPQFRERFWVVFVRKAETNPEFMWRLSPRFVTVASTLDPIHPGTQLDGLERQVTKFVNRLTEGPCICTESHGFDEQDLRATGLASIEGYRRQGFSLLIQPKFFPTLDKSQVCRRHVSPFTSAQPSILAPGGWAPVLLGSSLWIYQGAPVSRQGFQAIMGFPTDYVFPVDRKHGVRTYLSKGVCPPVATWILSNIRRHFGCADDCEFTRPWGWNKLALPGRVVNFKPSRNRLLERYADMWELRSPESDELLPLPEDE